MFDYGPAMMRYCRTVGVATRRDALDLSSRPVRRPCKLACALSAMPGSVTDAGARVWPRKCGIVTFDVIEIDCPKCRLRLLQGRASLNLDKIIFEIITARKCGDHLVALLRRVLVISNSHDVHRRRNSARGYPWRIGRRPLRSDRSGNAYRPAASSSGPPRRGSAPTVVSGFRPLGRSHEDGIGIVCLHAAVEYVQWLDHAVAHATAIPLGE